MGADLGAVPPSESSWSDFQKLCLLGVVAALIYGGVEVKRALRPKTPAPVKLTLDEMAHRKADGWVRIEGKLDRAELHALYLQRLFTQQGLTPGQTLFMAFRLEDADPSLVVLTSSVRYPELRDSGLWEKPLGAMSDEERAAFLTGHRTHDPIEDRTQAFLAESHEFEGRLIHNPSELTVDGTELSFYETPKEVRCTPATASSDDCDGSTVLLVDDYHAESRSGEWTRALLALGVAALGVVLFRRGRPVGT